MSVFTLVALSVSLSLCLLFVLSLLCAMFLPVPLVSENGWHVCLPSFMSVFVALLARPHKHPSIPKVVRYEGRFWIIGIAYRLERSIA